MDAKCALTILLFGAVAFRGADAQDTLRIHADNPPVWGPSVKLTRAFAIGSADGPPEYAIGKIDGFAARSDGAFFVYDGQDVQIRMYDATGKFVKAIGRKGSGPGEYQNVQGMGFLGDSVLAVWDAQLLRVSYFDHAGVFTTSMLPGFGHKAPRSFGVDVAGRLYIEGCGRDMAPSGNEPLRCFVRLSRDGKVLDSVPIPPRNALRGFVVEVTTEGERWNFMHTTRTAFNPLGGVISGRTDRYALSLTIAGKPAIVERNYSPVPMRPEERAEWEALVRGWDDAMAKHGTVAPSRQPVPAVKPPFRDITTDGDGRVWVEVYTTATKRTAAPVPPGASITAQITWREAATFDVLASDGRILGRIALPPDATLLGARGKRVWLQTEGASGEPTIVAYQLGY